MSIMTLAPAAIGEPNDSWADGYLDGQIAAVTGLPSRRVHARISMAEQYDPVYAQAYSDGYLHATETNAAYFARQGN